MRTGAYRLRAPALFLNRTPRNRFIAEFVGANNVFSGAVHAIADGCITVVTPQGCFAVATPADHALGIGDNVTFVIGADKMKIGGDSQRAGNTVEGRVVAAEFTGSVATVFVELEQGFEFQVQKLSSQFDQTETAIGSTLRISWTGDDAYLLTGRDEAPRHARSQAEDAGRRGR